MLTVTYCVLKTRDVTVDEDRFVRSRLVKHGIPKRGGVFLVVHEKKRK